MFFALLLALFAEGNYDYTTCTLVATRPRLLPWRRVSQEMPPPAIVGAKVETVARVEPSPREKPTPDVDPQPEPPNDASAEAESEHRPWRPFRPHGPDPPEPVPRPVIDRVIHTGNSLWSLGSGLLTLAIVTPKLILIAEVLGLILFAAIIFRVLRGPRR